MAGPLATLARRLAGVTGSPAGGGDAGYVVVLPTPLFDLSPARCAGEGPLCEHLRLLRRLLGVQRLTIASPVMSRAEYERTRGQLDELDLAQDGVGHAPLYGADVDGRQLLRELGPALRTLHRLVRGCDVVHAGISANIYRPIEFLSLLLGAALGKKTICVDDIDRRRTAWMSYTLGRISLKEYAVTSLLHDPARALQLHAAVRLCSLVLLKGRRLVEDFGGGRPHVHDFLDAAFSEADVIPADALRRKLVSLLDPAHPLELVYFGRLVSYKGVARCLDALALASGRGAGDWRFRIIGAGPEERALRRQACDLGLGDRVVFDGPARFGPPLWAKLHPCHLLLAAPLAEDTPRSALDAMASGIPLLAFDTEYYKDLAARSDAVQLVPWPSVEALAGRLVDLTTRKEQLASYVQAAVRFAVANTQEVWLGRRVELTRALLGRPAPAAGPVPEPEPVPPAPAPQPGPAELGLAPG